MPVWEQLLLGGVNPTSGPDASRNGFAEVRAGQVSRFGIHTFGKHGACPSLVT